MGSRIFPQPEAAQPGHVGEVPIDLQCLQQRTGQIARMCWHIDAAEAENLLQNPKSKHVDPEKLSKFRQSKLGLICPQQNVLGFNLGR